MKRSSGKLMWAELHGLMNSDKLYNIDGTSIVAPARGANGGSGNIRRASEAQLRRLQDDLEALKQRYATLKRLDVNARNNGVNINERAELSRNMTRLRKKIQSLQTEYNTLVAVAASANADKRDNIVRSARTTNDRGSSDDTGFIAVNGSEPVFTEQRWSSHTGIKNNNCYSYAMNNFSDDRGFKAVPGDRSGYDHDLSYDKCLPLQKRLLDDNPDSIYKEVPKNKCKDGFSKIMLFVGNRDGDASYGDFHFFKHHNDIDYVIKKGDTVESVAKFLEVEPAVILTANNNSPRLRPGSSLFLKNFRTRDGRSVWSHKLGIATGAILNDACGKIITDPRSSCRKFSAIDYTKYCGTYCIRNAIAKSS